jgi:hypothetical protein
MILRVNSGYFQRFHCLTAASVKMAVLWVVTPCNLVEIYWRFSVLAASIIRAMSDDRDSKHL